MIFKPLQNLNSIIKFEELKQPDGEWELLESLDEGTYGEVFKVKNYKTGQYAAVKIMESINDVIEEIEEEYLILRDLATHPNLPEFYGIYLKRTEEENQVWLILELCSNGSVTDLVKSLIRLGLKLDENIIAYILKHTINGLEHLHRNHVMHRDVKGHNILITEECFIKLIDFGVSAHLKSSIGRRNTSVGTPFWMAPEVIACEQQLDYDYDVRCDIWSLGITAIELAEGEPPLSEYHPMRALFKIPRNPPPTLRCAQDWSAEYNDFIKKCLVKDFEKRPTINELKEHPFITRVNASNQNQFREQLKQVIEEQKRLMSDLKKNPPHVTTKHGKLKSKRKSKPYSPQTVDDLAALETFDEESIVNQLYNRFMQGQIYTYIGDILLSVNPFTNLTIYSEKWSKRYINCLKIENSPHIYAVADMTYQAMIHNQTSQCIIISGESGSGKTMSANFLVQQLTLLGKAPTTSLEEKILQVNPLMEAFGNAKTVINDNSSRFGKYLDMIFTKNGRVIGAQLHEYLLEKSRVVSQAPAERNFHIFYYLYDGLYNGFQKQDYHLSYDTKYKYLSNIDVSLSLTNRSKFFAIHNCFETIGFKSQEVNSIYSLLAGILHLGNLTFLQDEGVHNDGKCHVTNKNSLTIISQLLGIDKKELQDSLTQRSIVTRGETLIRSNSMQECHAARDSMSKGLYGRLFSWIVNKINLLLQPSETETEEIVSISILDIFGFENFAQNSFEQLCINIANEQIQYYFNQHVFAWEMQEYLNENIDGSEIVFIDNRHVLDMFLSKPMGLLSLLDEESRFPKASDSTLVEKFHSNIKSPSYVRPKSNELIFTIQHYAGLVQYDVNGFLEKNSDYISPEIISLLRQSEISLIRSLFRNQLSKLGEHPSNLMSVCNLSYEVMLKDSFDQSRNSTLNNVKNGKQSKKLGSNTSQSRTQATVATYFRYSLMDLLSKMVAGQPHFVRCLRPNKEKISSYFDSEIVSVQLKYTGVLETTKIRRLGYSHRITYIDFVRRYSILAYPVKSNISETRESCVEILTKLGLTNWKLGKTKIFLKYYHAEQLSQLFEEMNKKIILIQCTIRRWLARRSYFQQKSYFIKAATVIQSHYRGYQVRKIELLRKKYIISLQSLIRGYITRLRFKEKLELQMKNKKQDNYERLMKRIKTIQSHWRGHEIRKVYRELKLDRNTKAMQVGYFNQQVELLGNEAFMSVMKTNYQINQNEKVQNKKVLKNNAISDATNKISNNNLPKIELQHLPPKLISREVVDQIKRSLERKASVISKQRSLEINNELANLPSLVSGAQANKSNDTRISISEPGSISKKINHLKPNIIDNQNVSSNLKQKPVKIHVNKTKQKPLLNSFTNYYESVAVQNQSAINKQVKPISISVVNYQNETFPNAKKTKPSLKSKKESNGNFLNTYFNTNRYSFQEKSTEDNEQQPAELNTNKEDDSPVKYNFRALLRKTGQDLTNGNTLTRYRSSSETKQIDFRNVLRSRTNSHNEQ